MQLNPRPYQAEVIAKAYEAWESGLGNVLIQLPTGTGKTVVFSEVVRRHNGASCVIAHRKELISQIALALAKDGVRHRIIGPDSLIKFCVQEQLRRLGESLFDPNARCAVASVQTIVNRQDQLKHWMAQVTLWVCDEGHHLTVDSIWGKVVARLTNAKGLSVSAFPKRADGKGLGRSSHGVIDVIVQGPPMRWHIEQGYLVDYRIFCPQSDLDLSQVSVTDSGEFSPKPLKKAVQKSHIFGDVVSHYMQWRGKLGVCFSVDIETATEQCVKFNNVGVRAEIITGNTPDQLRSETIRRYERREIEVLVAVDVISEGFDLPAIEVAMLARPTMSGNTNAQQIGRTLRPIYAPGFDLETQAGRLAAIAASCKPYAIIHDHVGNIVGNAAHPGHGLPDALRVWSLEPREKGRRSSADDDSIPLKPCPQCTRAYERFKTACPYCNFVPVVAIRTVEYVDGNLFELTAETLATMRGAIAHIDMSVATILDRAAHANVPPAGLGALRNRHIERQAAQSALRASIAWWAGWQRDKGRNDGEIYKLFYLSFGTDILTAQSLGRAEAMELADKINMRFR